MSPDILRPRLQLALGSTAALDAELPALRGRRAYAAHAHGTGRQLLVTLHPAPPEGPHPARLATKIAQLSQLGHASVVLPLAMGDLDGRAWVVEGDDGLVTVGERLHDRGALPFGEAVRVVRDVARALTAMHRRGIGHGALSLDTVLFAPEGTLLTGLALHEGGDVPADLDAFFGLARSLFYGERSGGSVIGRRLPPEITALLDSMGSADPARRPARADAVLAVLDTFPVREASPLGTMLDSAGRGARARGVKPGMLVLMATAVVLLIVIWLATRH